MVRKISAIIYSSILERSTEYAIIPAPIVRLNTFEIPQDLSFAEASLLEPLVSVMHGQRVIQIQPGEHVAIIGAGGPIGLMHLQMARLSGAAQVIAVDLSEARLKVAAKLGATATINPAKSIRWKRSRNSLPAVAWMSPLNQPARKKHGRLRFNPFGKAAGCCGLAG